jgi:hypothetical protein
LLKNIKILKSEPLIQIFKLRIKLCSSIPAVSPLNIGCSISEISDEDTYANGALELGAKE